MQIATYSGTKALLEKYGHNPRKSLGQNFLIDPHVLGKIIRAANIGPHDAVLEIGSGIGGLTQALLEYAGHVLTIELDKRLAETLKETLPKAEVIQGDILKYNIPNHINKVVANLPYYISTPVIMRLLEDFQFKTITVMVQREVAHRLVSLKKDDKSHGALSLGVQYHATAKIAAYVPSNSFIPRPRVGSAVVHMEILKKPPVVADKALLFANIRAGFGQRRKTLVNGLYISDLYSLTKEELASVITSCGFSENIRGEDLSLEDWSRLTLKLSGGIKNDSF